MQTINLSKGETISLSKHPAIDLSKGGKGLSRVVVGLGWDPAPVQQSKGLLGFLKSATAPSIDCDAFAALCTVDNKIQRRDDIICFWNLNAKDGSVRHTGDNLTGDGDGDDEQIIVDLTKIRPGVDKVVIGVNIYNARMKGQHFGMLQNAFVRIYDATTNVELCKYNLNGFDSSMTSMLFGELVRQGNEWSFSATGIAVPGSSIEDVLRPFMG